MALPLDERILPCNWPELDDPRVIWNTYQAELEGLGYHLMGSEAYRTLGKDDGLPPPAAADPFRPKDGENFVHNWRLDPSNLYSQRHCSSWQPSVNVCFGIDRYRRPVVLKAVPNDDTELKVLRLLSSHPLRADKRNRTIPVLEFVGTRHNFVIVIMPSWGICWQEPACGSMATRIELALKLTETLLFLHGNGIAHGDIHPSNILINHIDTRDFDAPKENDFRLGFDAEYAFIDFGSSHVLEAGVSYGHPMTNPPEGFASPEQEAAAENQSATIDLFAADIYNLGKTLETELHRAFKDYGKSHMPDPREYRKILSDMTCEKASARPSGAEVVGLLRRVSGSMVD
ncbi:kinase-like domain-containing protein [Roridomyces roridus]|uniref:Kinase-like domain-containing protein n=1 Tax=Roridomyces roridus TaxID=1738132 RepID=A0AAD7C569_9AGAR|nr:kinase-like domain-containing protein [Roridomyces roridus]